MDSAQEGWAPTVPTAPLGPMEMLAAAAVRAGLREGGGREREKERKSEDIHFPISINRWPSRPSTFFDLALSRTNKNKQNTKQRRVRRRSFLKKTPEQQAASAVRRGELPRVLGRADLYLLSLGSVVGAGCFVLTGVAAKDHAGPSVSLSYLFAAAAALLSAVCYLEFAVESPRAGGAFSYVSIVGGCASFFFFAGRQGEKEKERERGSRERKKEKSQLPYFFPNFSKKKHFRELPAWIVASNLILEYSLSIAAVARAATAYACTLVGASSPSATLIKVGTAAAKKNPSSSSDPSSSQPLIELDPLAAAGILAITALLASGTAATARFNAVVTLVNLIAIFYIVLAAAPLAEASNLKPFAPEGMRGVFAASSVVFFAFVGFDTVATAAEDALVREEVGGFFFLFL